ncbi:pheromone precursor protein [Grosmannia clavigera kw1407]|uniref:Pheromone protein n=1 Tax=Grosmannia clavigera (strain kw1407 / UAMH 11150) TaxID=655863 RepID=F0XS08_GROCL|nr:pheromone precursor protein [Grosmannia clavigera kw1407]EFW99502.1 pheromone precursor protein [Grosmannia clavigera kw1407]
MKTAALLTILAAGATSVSAAAVAAADADTQWCQWYGQACWKVKRTAEAFAEAVADAGGVSGGPETSISRRSNAPGGLADQVKRGLDDLAGIIASTQRSPVSYYGGLNLAGAFPAPTEVTKREADAEADADADASPEAEAQWCQWYGQACWKVRRAAEAVVTTIEGFGNAESKRSFEPLVAGKREAGPSADAGADAGAEPQWCQWYGQGCWKRDTASIETRCHAPDGACSSARRDLHGIYNTARQVLDLLPAQ